MNQSELLRCCEPMFIGNTIFKIIYLNIIKPLHVYLVFSVSDTPAVGTEGTCDATCWGQLSKELVLVYNTQHQTYTCASRCGRSYSHLTTKIMFSLMDVSCYTSGGICVRYFHAHVTICQYGQ